MADIFTLEELAAYLQIQFQDLNIPSAELFRELVTIEIRTEIGHARYDAITDVSAFKPIALEYAKRTYVNPGGHRSEQESIDDYSRQITYAIETASAPEFTADERRRLRRAAGIRAGWTMVLGSRP